MAFRIYISLAFGILAGALMIAGYLSADHIPAIWFVAHRGW